MNRKFTKKVLLVNIILFAILGNSINLKAQELLAKLTPRENQVLERITAGRLNKQIADDLNISIKTVEAHRANIMTKVEARTVAELIKIALTANEGVQAG